ncbi:hypothetical protein DIPPA_20026 [Diplonema papillatum]|nr:hypothetical protein DIPPA_20026 [Diplonema papillatum]
MSVYGSPETDLLVVKIKLESKVRELREQLIQCRNQLAEAQDDSNELASAIASLEDERNQLSGDLDSIKAALRHLQGEGEQDIACTALELSKQLQAVKHELLSVVPTRADAGDMARDAAKQILEAREELQDFVDGDGDDDRVGISSTSLPYLAAEIKEQLRHARASRSESDEAAEVYKEQALAVQMEYVRVSADLDEEKRAAKEAAALRAKLADQIDVHVWRSNVFASRLASTLCTSARTRLARRYFNDWLHWV